MAAWVKEIRSIYSIIDFSLSNVFRECNMLDVLAKDGASYFSLVFDV